MSRFAHKLELLILCLPEGIFHIPDKSQFRPPRQDMEYQRRILDFILEIEISNSYRLYPLQIYSVLPY